MMTDFTLSSVKSKALPSTITVDGSAFEINSSYRTILKIFRMLDDPEILDGHKSALLCKWFFPQEVPDSWEAAFKRFVNGGPERDAGTGKKDIDYEFDAPEIYLSLGEPIHKRDGHISIEQQPLAGIGVGNVGELMLGNAQLLGKDRPVTLGLR